MQRTGISVGLASPRFLRLGFIVSIVALPACGHMTASPPPAPKGQIGYMTDTAGNVVRNASGQCYRTGFWQPAYAIKECDPELVAQAQPAKPPEVASAPAEPEPQEARSEAADTEEPSAVAEAPAEPVRVYVGADAYFEFDQAELTDDARRGLEKIAERAQEADEASIQIVGYADHIGPEDYNLSLSQQRADAVRTYFIEQGVPEAVLSMDARGATDPVVNCEGRQGASLIDCLQPNRRTEIEFTALESVEGG